VLEVLRGRDEGQGGETVAFKGMALRKLMRLMILWRVDP
jgi:hypothetical protein